MGIRIEYPDGSTEILPTASGANHKLEDGKVVFCDSSGVPIKTIDDEEGLTWRPAEA